MLNEPERFADDNPFTPIPVEKRLSAAPHPRRGVSRPLTPGTPYGAPYLAPPAEPPASDLPVADVRAPLESVPDYLRAAPTPAPAPRRTGRTGRTARYEEAPPALDFSNNIPGLTPWEIAPAEPSWEASGAYQPSAGSAPYDPQALTKHALQGLAATQPEPVEPFAPIETIEPFADAPPPEEDLFPPVYDAEADLFPPIYDAEPDALPPESSASLAPEPPQRAPKPGMPVRAKARLDQATERMAARVSARLRAINPWRLAALICCSLALLICVLEVGQIVYSVWRNELEMKQSRAAYLEREGESLDRRASRVDLLPAGQTFVPTAAPEALLTPTPSPRIAQHDPLIGVVDAGGQVISTGATPAPTVAVRTKLSTYPENQLFNEDPRFAELRAANPDVIGQITIDGVLDETVVSRNNTYYLAHNARGLFSATGAIFLDESCGTLRRPPENLILRGQCAFDGKLFAPLLQYANADFAREHSVIRMDTIYERSEYLVFAVVHAESRVDSAEYFNYAGYATFQTDAQMLGYVSGAMARSIADFGVEVQAGDRLRTLATLSEGDDTSSWVVLARRKRTGE